MAWLRLAISVSKLSVGVGVGASAYNIFYVEEIEFFSLFQASMNAAIRSGGFACLICFNSSRALCKFSARPLKSRSCPTIEDDDEVVLEYKWQEHDRAKKSSFVITIQRA